MSRKAEHGESYFVSQKLVSIRGKRRGQEHDFYMTCRKDKRADYAWFTNFAGSLQHISRSGIEIKETLQFPEQSNTQTVLGPNMSNWPFKATKPRLRSMKIGGARFSAGNAPVFLGPQSICKF